MGRVVLYAAFLVEKGRQSSTIKSYISAIKFILKADGYEWDNSKMLLQTIVCACRIENDRIKTRYPIQIGLLEILLFEVNREFEFQPYLRVLYKTVFALSYYGLFRVGEVAAGEHQIKAHDVHIARNKEQILIILRSSKMHGKEFRPQK